MVLGTGPQDAPRRETLELMPPGTSDIMYTLFVLAMVVFLTGFYWKIKAYLRGRPGFRFDRLGVRLRRVWENGVVQARTAKKRYAGAMHLLLFWGFTILFIGTVIVLIDYDITQPAFDYQFLKGNFYLGFETVLDAAGIALLLGLGLAIRRRAVARPVNLVNSFRDTYMLSVLLFLGVTGFLLEGLRLAIRDPPWGTYSFVGIVLRPAFNGLSLEAQLATYATLWWSHAVVTFTFIASLPFTKFQHILTSPANLFFGTPYDEGKAPAGRTPHYPKGELPTTFNLQQVLASGKFEDVRLGAKRLEDFSQPQLLSLEACTECGRCTDACPASAAGRPLSPMHVVLNLRDELRAQTAAELARPVFQPEALPPSVPEDVNLLVNDVIQEETLWSCVTCRACMEACPVMIEHVPIIVEMRRALVAESRIDKQKSNLLQNLTSSGNAYGFPNSERAKWAEGLDVPILGQVSAPQEIDVLYWVGCSGSFDARNQQVSRSLVKVLKAANVRFAILGEEEKCNGDPARRLGEEGRFQELMLANIETFKKYNVRRVITQCPHCFNTIKNEYRKFGLELEVQHHSQFVGELLASGRLKPSVEIREAMTYHDSCYLGRYNDEYDAPREMLTAAGANLVEMERSRENSFCCGGGGSNIWFEVKEEKERISVLRIKEAVGTGASRVATACPFCMTMLDDANKLAGREDAKVQDVVEILAESLGPRAS